MNRPLMIEFFLHVFKNSEQSKSSYYPKQFGAFLNEKLFPLFRTSKLERARQQFESNQQVSQILKDNRLDIFEYLRLQHRLHGCLDPFLLSEDLNKPFKIITWEETAKLFILAKDIFEIEGGGRLGRGIQI